MIKSEAGVGSDDVVPSAGPIGVMQACVDPRLGTFR